MAKLETVYAIHSFEAENQDEIGFTAGDPIVVLEKDEGYNDGWWQGRNARGEIGLFPMNYTTAATSKIGGGSDSSSSGELDKKISSLENAIAKIQNSPSRSGLHPLALPSSQLPTPSSSTCTHQSSFFPLDTHSMASSFVSGSVAAGGRRTSTCDSNSSSLSDSVGSESETAPLSSPSSTAPSPPILRNFAISRHVQTLLEAALNHPRLVGTMPEDWDVDQVAAWMYAMGFGSVAENFKAQEITGDILIELTLHSLKELDIDTFGKRFKIHIAILALREFFKLEEKGCYGSRFHDMYYSGSSDDDGNGDLESISTAATSPVDSVRSSSSEELAIPRPTCRKMSIERKNVPVHDIDLYNNSIHSRRFIQRSPFSPTSKPQTVLTVAHHPSFINSDGNSYPGQHHRHHRHMTTVNVLPDMEGWLNKQGDKYKTWNKRWFVLKGPNLFYFKSPKDVRMKGIINLRGYRVICDERIYAGKWCMKIQHERERTFSFYTEAEDCMRAWMKALLKATISRDYGAPVLSSSTVTTISLDVARRMNPRPPSMILYKKEQRRASAMEFHTMESIEISGYHNARRATLGGSVPSVANSGQDESEMITSKEFYTTDGSEDNSDEDYSSYTRTIESQQELQDSGFDGAEEGAMAENKGTAMTAEAGRRLSRSVMEGGRPCSNVVQSKVADTDEWTTLDYLDWIRDRVSSGHRISSLDELRSGQVLVELLENLSGMTVRRPPKAAHGSTSMEMLETIVAAFKFMSREGIDVEGRITIKDVFGGNEPKLKEMLDIIRLWADSLK
ncbi:hypothetical protein BX666DRAFT_1970688 [Dichotomocladium elegans]|nr:hypothetical protein BX666DRAFT_1970688 [Dichotomocladium elegans]